MNFFESDADIEEVVATYRLAGIHPVARLFPSYEEAAFNDLCHSISRHGVEMPIILTHDNYLLDGKSRLKACYLTGQVPRWEKKSDLYKDDYVGLAFRLNFNRHHLTHGQQAQAFERAFQIVDVPIGTGTIKQGQTSLDF